VLYRVANRLEAKCLGLSSSSQPYPCRERRTIYNERTGFLAKPGNSFGKSRAAVLASLSEESDIALSTSTVAALAGLNVGQARGVLERLTRRGLVERNREALLLNGNQGWTYRLSMKGLAYVRLQMRLNTRKFAAPPPPVHS
jgi:hypothetical protein